MKEQIKILRTEIDGLAQLCEGLKPITRYFGGVDPYEDNTTPSVLAYPNENSQEIKEAIKSLKLSKAWLGKVLESLGSENPYGSGYKTVEDIVPETDVNRGFLHEPEDDEKPWISKSHIERVDWLRTEIKRTAIQLYNTIYFKEIGVSEGELAYKYICEARFWLGFEMGRIRDESK